MSDYYTSKSLEATGLKSQSSSDIVTRESIGLQQFQVILDKIQHVYYAGEIISGKVKLQLNSPISAMGVKLECRGEGHVYFTNRSTGFRRKLSTQEIYLHEEIYLTRNDYSTEAEIKSDGFSFSISLPEKLPCSFEGRYGRARYSIKSTLEITKDSQISSEPLSFTVAPVLDLNHHSLAPLPISESHTKTFTGHLKPLSMSVFLPVRGFVPGQTVPLKIHLKNESNVDVKKLRIVLKKVVVYRSANNTRKHKEIVVEIEQPVQRNCQVYDGEFDVPAIPPSVPLNNYEDPMESSDDSQTNSKSENSGQLKGRVDEDNTSVALNGLKYHHSRIYRSSKPEQDDPVGGDGDSDGDVKPYSPMYRVYKFESLRDRDFS